MRVLRQLGITIEDHNAVVLVHGKSLNLFTPPKGALDCRNSGTTMRLMSGLLVAAPFPSKLTGDTSLLSRPMRRITDPLQKIGGKVTCSENGCAPLFFKPSDHLRGTTIDLQVPSAQVASALLIAGLFTEGQITIKELRATRDHSERMLKAFSASVHRQGLTLKTGINRNLRSTSLSIVSDFSSAAFFMTAAAMVEGSDILLSNIGVNPRRVGCAHILRQMGADIRFLNKKVVCGEDCCDIRVRPGRLLAVDISGQTVTDAIDEIPIIMVAASQAQGLTRIRNAEELRHKESDRLKTMAGCLKKCGVSTTLTEDGIEIHGKQQIQGACVDSFGDHRISMAMAIAGCIATSPIHICNCTNVATSFPQFSATCQALGLCVQEYGPI